MSGACEVAPCQARSGRARALTIFPDPLRPVPGTSSTDETSALVNALREGDARVKIGAAATGAWQMRHRPQVAFRCGPYALVSVAEVWRPSSRASEANSSTG